MYPEPGSGFLIENVELTLKPDGPLANGGNSEIITKKLIDIGGGEDGINDVPISKDKITAKDKSNNQSLQIRLRNKGEYGNSVT